MIKKLLFGVIAFVLIGVITLFAVNGKDHYDAAKYHLTADNGLNTGSKLSLTLPDQFDKAHTLTPDTKKLILVFAKSTGHTVKAFLKTQDKSYLPQHHTLFIADISPMPTVIRNTFALPDFKKSPYSVLLIYDKALAKQLKNEKESDKIALVTLEDNTIKSVDYVTTEEALKAWIEKE